VPGPAGKLSAVAHTGAVGQVGQAGCIVFVSGTGGGNITMYVVSQIPLASQATTQV
jgi:hypothetical protein